MNLLPTMFLLFSVWMRKDLTEYYGKDTEAYSQFSFGFLPVSLCSFLDEKIDFLMVTIKK